MHRCHATHVRCGGVISAALGLLCLFAVSSIRASTDDLSGVWLVNANGYTFRLELAQSGSTIRGTLFGINNENPPTKIEGAADEGGIRFTRVGDDDNPSQHYSGQVILDPDGRRMVGTFESDGITGYGWCAVDARVAAAPDPTQWQDCPPAVDPDDFELRFVGFEDGRFSDLTDLAYGRTFFVEVRFAREQEASSYDVELHWGEASTEMVRVRRSPGDATMYRSEEIVIAAPEPETGPSP